MSDEYRMQIDQFNKEQDAPDPPQGSEQAEPKLPIGTRIRFPREVDSPANEEHPHLVYAYAGEEGEIVGHNEWEHEGYMVKSTNWPHPFGAKREEFEPVVSEQRKHGCRECGELYYHIVPTCPFVGDASGTNYPVRDTERAALPEVVRPVTQPWTHALPMMQQTVLLTAVRGPDGLPKYAGVKMLLRWFRRCTLLSAMDGRALTNPYDNNGGSFTGPSFPVPHEPWEEMMEEVVSDYLRTLDAIPHHFQLHFMHAAEIVGYKHPNQRIQAWWRELYFRLVNDMHLKPEFEDEMDERLGDNREGWLKRADAATVA